MGREPGREGDERMKGKRGLGPAPARTLELHYRHPILVTNETDMRHEPLRQDLSLQKTEGKLECLNYAETRDIATQQYSTAFW
jgi:hypothetical protein